MTKNGIIKYGLLWLVVVMIVAGSAEFGFAESYPTKATISDYGTHSVYSVGLAKDYTFNCEHGSYGTAVFITHVHTAAAIPMKNNDSVYFAGKHKGRFFFNRGMDARALYSWKPGEHSFTLEAKNINIDQFKKYNTIPWPLVGAKVGKYVTASKYIPLEPAPRNQVYIYNLSKGTKRLLDRFVFGVKTIGKKMYYVRTDKNSSTGISALIIKKCNPKSSKRVFVKRIQLPKRCRTVYKALLTKHYVNIVASGWNKKIRYR